VEEQINAFREYTKHSSATLRDLASTLANKREQKPHRAYVVTSDSSDIQASVTQAVQPQFSPRVAWVFTGQGAQWPEMGAELIAKNTTFRATVQKLDKFLLSLPTPPPWTIEGTQRNLVVQECRVAD
jgi:acyl transferase domain-containing protein